MYYVGHTITEFPGIALYHSYPVNKSKFLATKHFSSSYPLYIQLLSMRYTTCTKQTANHAPSVSNDNKSVNNAKTFEKPSK